MDLEPICLKRIEAEANTIARFYNWLLFAAFIFAYVAMGPLFLSSRQDAIEKLTSDVQTAIERYSNLRTSLQDLTYAPSQTTRKTYESGKESPQNNLIAMQVALRCAQDLLSADSPEETRINEILNEVVATSKDLEKILQSQEIWADRTQRKQSQQGDSIGARALEVHLKTEPALELDDLDTLERFRVLVGNHLVNNISTRSKVKTLCRTVSGTTNSEEDDMDSKLKVYYFLQESLKAVVPDREELPTLRGQIARASKMLNMRDDIESIPDLLNLLSDLKDRRASAEELSVGSTFEIPTLNIKIDRSLFYIVAIVAVTFCLLYIRIGIKEIYHIAGSLSKDADTTKNQAAKIAIPIHRAPFAITCVAIAIFELFALGSMISMRAIDERSYIFVFLMAFQVWLFVSVLVRLEIRSKDVTKK